jgi:cyclopropane fatty-acyl-phospholipid synthase-like methyltransferase
MSNDKSDVELDGERIRDFWERRARNGIAGRRVGLSNLEPDPVRHERKVVLERQVMDEYVTPKAGEAMLDLGAGHGFWAMHFAPRVGRIDCVEYSSAMVQIAADELQRRGIGNVSYHCMSAQDYLAESTYDLVLISGLLIYLGSTEVSQLLDHLVSMTSAGSRIVLRDGTARSQNYLIDGKYSETLQDHYSAYYRTAAEYIELFEARGFRSSRHQDMFDADSGLNKWNETVLRVYEFHRDD